MAQYEQKTDSREFEVANPDQHTGPWGSNSPADAADIAIRLWGATRPDRRVPLTWKTESVLVYMIADLVGASRGRIAEESQSVLAAHFDSCRQAVVAAKRIQTALLEFLACRPGERTGGAILIFQPRTADPTGPSGELVQLELGRAKPGQILLTENVFRRMRDLPGMEFATASGETTEDGPTGSTELVWTTPDRVALMQESVGDAAEPIVADTPPMGATLIVNSPIMNSPNLNSPNLNSPNMDPSFARRGQTTNTAAPAARTQDHVAPETRSRRAAEFNPKPSSSLTEELEIGERPLFTRTRVILGVVAVVLVAALIAVFLQPTRVAKPLIPQTPQTQEPTAPSATGNADQSTPPADAPRAQTPPPKAEPPKAAAKPPAAFRKPPAEIVAKNKKEIPAQDTKTEDSKNTPEQPAVVDESGNWALSDIPRLLTMAGSDMGDGKYDKARREYRIVLRLQPKNQPALDGISKLNKIQSDQQ
jgi:hypothetical protein